MKVQKCLIGGQWCETSEKHEVINPFTNELISTVISVNSAELTDIIVNAVEAAERMKNLSRFRIADALREVSFGIETRKNEFAETIAKESAKPIKLARGEVSRGIATFLWAAGEAERWTGDVVPIDTQAGGTGKTAWTKRVPLGVIYGITPFNFPLNLVCHKVAPALAAGNSIIIKPSPKTPLTALLLGEVFLESGLPKSALQIAPMDVGYMDGVLADERIKMISFTGNDRIGWKLKETCRKKKISLELGGNAPVIIDESADLDKAIDQTIMGAFAYSGQVCISVQRILLHEKIADEFTDRFVKRAKDLKKGDPMRESSQISAMIDEEAAIKAKAFVDEAVENGAKLHCGNNRDGSIFDATVLSDVKAEMPVVTEEVFAPIAVIQSFSNFREAIKMANNSRFGLQVGLFTNNLENSQIAANSLEFGGVIINDVPTFRIDNMPYGGVKDSGFGREGVRFAMEEMSEPRLIVLNS